MTQKTAGCIAIAAAIALAGCGTVYPRQANVDAMSSLRSEFESRAGLAELRSAVAENESALIRVARESRADAAAAGPTKAGEQLDSSVLATEASYFLLRLPADRQTSEGVIQSLGSSVSAFAESVSAEAQNLCHQNGGPGGTKMRSCWEADLLFDAVRTAPLVDYLRDAAGADVATMTDADWQKLTNTMSELAVVFEEEWTGELANLGGAASAREADQQTQERLKYFMPYLCYADEAMITIAARGGELSTDAQRQQMRRFDAAGSAAIAKGASLPNFSPKPETLASCSDDTTMGEAVCRTNANWAAVSQKCGAIRTCIAQSGDQTGCVSRQIFSSPES